jgi:RHS repeat-associated protein
MQALQPVDNINMKTINTVVLLLLPLTSALATTPEVVVSKTLSAYEGRSYLYKTEIVLRPGFEVNGITHGDFFIAFENIVNQPASVDRNFVRSELTLIKGVVTESQLSSLTSDKKRTTYNYSDGLGRFTQEVSLEESPSKSDIVRFAAYDDFGREPINYLPVTIKDNVGGFVERVLERQKAYYAPIETNRPYAIAADNEPYSVNVFDNSPLNTVLQSYGPGEDWHQTKANKPKRTALKVNAANEVRMWTFNGVDLPQSPAFYAGNVLNVNETIDEENYIQRTYSNFRGQVILERKGDGTAWFDTYFIYDPAGNLRYVFPPEATTRIFQANSQYHGKTIDQQQAFIDLWAYQYKYDLYNRVSEKRIPGAGWIYMLYDRWDRLVLLQDATQRLTNQWTFTKYDIHNRVVMTGITTGTRAAMQNGLDAAINRFELPAANSIGYSNNTFPSHTDADLLSVNYFDSYTFLSNSGWDAEGLNYSFIAEPNFDQTYWSALKGYSTGAKVKLLGTSKWLNSVIYYNSQYQVIQTIAENHLGGIDRTTKLIDFDGTERMVKQIHGSPTGSLTLVEEYDYDHARRLIRLKHQINNGPKINLASKKYNELGQCIEKDLHSVDNGSSFLQSVDNRYNIRGWITSINNSKLTNDGIKNNDSGDLFGMEIMYNEPQQSIADGNNGTFTTRKMYDGNISAIRWMTDNRSGTLPKENIYGFAYDATKRFKNSYYATNNSGQWTSSPGYFNEAVSRFDANGNIGGEINGSNAAALTRTGILSGTKVAFDNLTYRYTGNQLKNVTDNSNNNFGFSDKPGIPLTTDEFYYDANGNLKEDMNRSISKITYNHLNLPTIIEITRSDGKVDKVEFLYDAAGTKLSRIVKLNNVQVWKTDFVSGKQYDNGKISFMTTPEGRAVFNGATYDYEYFYKDHQDNVRLVYGALKETSRYKATMEPELASTEEDSVTGFGNIASRRTSSSNGAYNYTVPSDKTPNPGYSAMCNAFENRTIGPAKALRVMAGDIVYMETFARYTVALNSGHQTIAAAAVGMALNAALAISPTTETKLYNGINANAGPASGTVLGGTPIPKAYLAFLFFDDNYNFQRGGAVGISINALNSFEKLSRSFTADKSGYLYVYVASESNVSTAKVYFDDTYIIHQMNNVVLQVTQSSDYYPFGLSFNEYQADRLRIANTTPETTYEPTLRNRYRFQEQEQQTDLNLGWYAYKYRMHDPATGRFSSVDPLAEDYKYNSAYAFSENKLIDGVELEGLEWRRSTSGEVIAYYDFGNTVAPGHYGFIQPIGMGADGYYTYIGRMEFEMVCDQLTGSMCMNPTTFNSKAFFSHYNNMITILFVDGTVLNYNTNGSNMIELPHSGSEVTGLGNVGEFSINGNRIYQYYNRNDVAGAGEDQWARPQVLVGLLNSIFQYQDIYPNESPTIGDMRSPNDSHVMASSSQPHHTDPAAIDIRYLGAGGSYQGTVNDSRFSAERNRIFINLMGQNGFREVIVGNSVREQVRAPGIQMVEDSKKTHTDHMHFESYKY